MEMHQLLQTLGDNVKIKLIDKDNIKIGNYDLDNMEHYFIIKENYFSEVINNIEVKDNMLVVILKNYSQFEHKTIQELQELGLPQNRLRLHEIFFELNTYDLRTRPILKKEILSNKGRQNLKLISKSYFSGSYMVVMVVLQNGEWFEVQIPTISWQDWGVMAHDKEHDKEYYEQYLNK